MTKTPVTKKTPVPAPETAPIEEKEKVPVKAKSFDANDYIPCRCVKGHYVCIRNTKSGSAYPFYGYGDEQEIEFQDLRGLVTARSGFLFDPSIIILDDDVLNLPQFKKLKDIYERTFSTEDIDALFELDDLTFKERLLSATNGTKDLILASVTRMLKEGTFESIAKLRMIDEVFKTNLKDFI